MSGRLFSPAILTVLIIATAAPAQQDTLYVYGGPGSLEGRFETAEGAPDRQGWVGVDLTQITTSRWHVDTFHCDNLDPGQPDNHAWWCGDLYESCGPGDPAEGYGNGYNEYLDWHGTVPDPDLPVTVTLTAMLNYDTEPDYDYLFLEYESATGMMVAETFNYQQDGVAVAAAVPLSPADYVGSQSDQVHLRWRFVSDHAWSDEDCRWSTAGAAQIDLIEVFFDQGSGPVQIGTTETCEPGDPLQWEIAFPPGVGDFSQVWPLLDDLDPDDQNDTPQFAFIDDGVVVPGTGGSYGVWWTYGPGGYTIHRHSMSQWINEIWSPPISLGGPANSNYAVVLSYDVYEHMGMCQPQAGRWRIRSRAGDVWSDWQWPEDWITADGEYLHIVQDVRPYLAPDDTEVQIALGVGFAFSDVWCYIATGQTPAPYYDNVSMRVVRRVSGLPDGITRLWLSDPVPNPFNPRTELVFEIGRSGDVRLDVYDLRGRLIRRLADDVYTAGAHSVTWNGTDSHGRSVPSGRYFGRLQASDEVVTRSMTLVR